MPGSGYCKPTNPVLAQETKSAMDALLAARAAQDAKWAAAWTAPSAMTTMSTQSSQTLPLLAQSRAQGVPQQR
jgi:hypothetical protein